MDNNTLLPTPGEIFLDHVGWFVADMRVAERAFERLGFVLTPYAEHVNATAEGHRVPSGTANRCAMLQRGYLEFLAAVPGSDTAIARQFGAGLNRYQGVHLIAFAVADADIERTRLANAGFEPQSVVRLRRPVPLDGHGEEIASFTVVRTPPERMPEGRIQFLAHETPELLWQRDLLVQENAIEALTGVLLVVPDVDTVADRYARFTGRQAQRLSDCSAVICLDRGRIVLVAPVASGATTNATVPLPAIRAVSLQSANLATTRRYLEHRGIELADAAADHLVVHANDAAGAELVIHARGADVHLYERQIFLQAAAA